MRPVPTLLSATAIVACAICAAPAWAQTLDQALSQAYLGNPTLNAQRASVRARDENVPQAKAGLRPRASVNVDGGAEYTSITTQVPATRSPLTGKIVERAGRQTDRDVSYPRGAGLTIEQPLFDGFRTQNSVKQANSDVLSGRERLRVTEQNVLFDAVEAYMNVLRDFAIFDLRRNNVELLEEELRATRERFEVGEVTRTDVAQSESRLAGSRSDLSVAEANLKTSRAIYRQIVGSEPRTLYPARPIDRLLPRSQDAAIAIGLEGHPAILEALHNVDVALLQVKVIEGELYPSVSIEGNASRRWDEGTAEELDTASVVGRLTVPLFQGGQEYARIRQAKETLGQRRIEADLARDEVRAAIVSAWGVLEGARAQIIAAQAQVEAAQTAFNGVREEARVGQRTTLDVLNAQQELLDARVTLITAQRDRVVASYSLLQSTGRLSAQRLALRLERYDPRIHYDQVKDKWFGVRTPDGR